MGELREGLTVWGQRNSEDLIQMLRNHMVAQLELHSSALQLVHSIVPHLTDMEHKNKEILDALVQQKLANDGSTVPPTGGISLGKTSAPPSSTSGVYEPYH